MINVGIAGVTGDAGIELVKLISNHPKAKLCAVNSNSYKGKALTDVFPSMRGFETLICEDLDGPPPLAGTGCHLSGITPQNLHAACARAS